ncbi:MAG TPA: NfeD family protein [Intrasporangium sp.]|nr:NfeD family protein [Intrasporangium sp.]
MIDVDMVVLGAVLMAAGMAVVVAEAHASTGGVLGLVGLMVGVVGVALVMAGAGVALVVAVPVAAALAVTGAGATLLVAREVRAARRQELRTGPETLVGRPATVRSWSYRTGQVAAEGSLWQARLAYGWTEPRPRPGEPVVISELDGLTVSIRRPLPGEEVPPWRPSSLSL